MAQSEVSSHGNTSSSTEFLRQKVREYTQKERSDARAKTTDALRFGLGELKIHLDAISLNENDVKGLASRIKRRKHATKDDMYRLSHAFLLSVDNINAFSNTQGALQVLVKELTGSNFERQISAIECLCNLSLGEAHVCEKICNMSGSYLVTYLDSTEKRIKQTSLWTICNLLASGGRCAETFLKMELASKLLTIYVGSENSDYFEDAGICLHQLFLKTKHLLSKAHYMVITEMLMQKSPTSVGCEYVLPIIFDCDILNTKDQEIINQTFINSLIECVLVNLRCCSDLLYKSNRLRLVYAIRILANLLANNALHLNTLNMHLKAQWSKTLADFFNFLFQYKDSRLTFEILWLLRNVIEAGKQLTEENPNEMERFLASINVAHLEQP